MVDLQFDLKEFEEVSSTNEIVKHAIEQGVPEGLVCRAFVQTGGYGRQGRAWVSPFGGMYQSLLLRPAVPAANLPTLGLVVALAVRRAILAVAGVPAQVVSVKWPNDVVCDAGKLCGISFESHAGGVCIGIGVNVFRPAAEEPVGGKNVPAYMSELPGSRLAGKGVDEAYGDYAREVIREVGDAILASFSSLYGTWLQSGFAALAAEFEACSSLTGKQVRVEGIDGSLFAEGNVAGVAENGCLLVRTPDGMRSVFSGEAHIV